MTIQREEWKKKLMGRLLVKLATGMNEAKEFSSLEKFLEREDKRIAEQL